MFGSGQMVGGIVNGKAEQEVVRCIMGIQGMLGSDQMHCGNAGHAGKWLDVLWECRACWEVVRCIVGMQGMLGSGQMYCGNAGHVGKWSDGRRDRQ